MREKALEKIRGEIDRSNGLSNIQAIGEFVLREIEKNDFTAEKVVNSEVTLFNAWLEVESVARDKASGRKCVMLTDEEVYGIVAKKYGFEVIKVKEIKEEVKVTAPVGNSDTTDKATETEDEFSMDLDDYL